MRLFYTGKGDHGQSVVGRKKIPKTHPVMDALGDLDELNSLIGLVRSKVSPGNIRKTLRDVQEALFIIQARIAVSKFGSKFPAPELKGHKIKKIEEIIDQLEMRLKPERGFVVTGETEKSAWLDLVRVVARRAERSVLKYNKSKKLDRNILAYLNRLSSLFFALARWESKKSGKKERHPKYK